MGKEKLEEVQGKIKTYKEPNELLLQEKEKIKRKIKPVLVALGLTGLATVSFIKQEDQEININSNIEYVTEFDNEIINIDEKELVVENKIEKKDPLAEFKINFDEIDAEEQEIIEEKAEAQENKVQPTVQSIDSNKVVLEEVKYEEPIIPEEITIEPNDEQPEVGLVVTYRKVEKLGSTTIYRYDPVTGETTEEEQIKGVSPEIAELIAKKPELANHIISEEIEEYDPVTGMGTYSEVINCLPPEVVELMKQQKPDEIDKSREGLDIEEKDNLRQGPIDEKDNLRQGPIDEKDNLRQGPIEEKDNLRQGPIDEMDFSRKGNTYSNLEAMIWNNQTIADIDFNENSEAKVKVR